MFHDDRGNLTRLVYPSTVVQYIDTNSNVVAPSVFMWVGSLHPKKKGIEALCIMLLCVPIQLSSDNSGAQRDDHGGSTGSQRTSQTASFQQTHS